MKLSAEKIGLTLAFLVAAYLLYQAMHAPQTVSQTSQPAQLPQTQVESSPAMPNPEALNMGGINLGGSPLYLTYNMHQPQPPASMLQPTATAGTPVLQAPQNNAPKNCGGNCGGCSDPCAVKNKVDVSSPEYLQTGLANITNTNYSAPKGVGNRMLIVIGTHDGIAKYGWRYANGVVTAD